MSGLLQELVGQKIWFWTTGGSTDFGTLDAAGVRWISITSAEGLLLMPLTGIRLIKVSGGGMTVEAAAGQLSPSLIGRKVRVSSIAGERTFQDTGELEAFDDDWLRVRVKSDQLYFSISNVTQVLLLSR